MQIEILGSGGAISAPRPLCTCRICAEAREKGLPYSRGGPSLFIHGPNLLVDTPEDILISLERSQVRQDFKSSVFWAKILSRAFSCAGRRFVPEKNGTLPFPL